MTPAQPITKGQRTKLITLWSQYSRRSLDVDGGREARLAWASKVAQRTIGSFNDLTAMEAARAISALNQSLGLPAHKPRSRDRGMAAGTHGRRGDSRKATEIASTEDLSRIDRALDRLGWDRSRFDAWLASPSSPLRNRTRCGSGGSIQLRTVADCNRVWWALKRLLQREGKWEE